MNTKLTCCREIIITKNNESKSHGREGEYNGHVVVNIIKYYNIEEAQNVQTELYESQSPRRPVIVF